MAKCIQNKETQDIRRLSDDNAFNMTMGGSENSQWKYIPKKVWKRFVRHPEKTVDKVS
jgi:hypothetical protein